MKVITAITLILCCVNIFQSFQYSRKLFISRRISELSMAPEKPNNYRSSSVAPKRNPVQGQKLQKAGSKYNDLSSQNEDQKNWKSGAIFAQHNRPQRRKADPWWMREEEKNNPDLLPIYKPWWSIKNFPVDSSWKVIELRAEAKRRNLVTTGSKLDLINRINESYQLYRLDDVNFTAGTFIPAPSKSSNLCYPEVYENNSNVMQ